MREILYNVIFYLIQNINFLSSIAISQTQFDLMF